MSGKSAEDYAEGYTEPELRARLKEEIKTGGRGGRPGQWSAGKSQLLAHEYEPAGGGYRHEGERTASQRHLEQWTAQDWHTGDGGADARGRGRHRGTCPTRRGSCSASRNARPPTGARSAATPSTCPTRRPPGRRGRRPSWSSCPPPRRGRG
jgi:hypothetical protein